MHNLFNQETLLEIVKQQLNASIGLASKALKSPDPREIARNTTDALKVYNAALRFRNRTLLLSKNTKLILDKLQELEELLIQLGAICDVADGTMIRPKSTRLRIHLEQVKVN